jgi:thioesterase DpgC
MMRDASATADTGSLRAAGLDQAAVAAWAAACQERTTDLAGDRDRYAQFWRCCDDLLARLPPKPRRNEAETAAAQAILTSARSHRERFLGAHAEVLYDRLTRNRSRFLRLDALLQEAAQAVPGLTPTREQLAAEQSKLQRDKEGIEIDQGLFLAHVLACERSGLHLCHAMLLPRMEAADLLSKLASDGIVELAPDRDCGRSCDA